MVEEIFRSIMSLSLYQLFSLCKMFGINFDNVSVLLNFVAAAHVH